MHIVKIFSFWWLEDSVGNIAKPVPSNPQNSRNLGFETGEPLLSVVVGVPSGDVALDRIDRASQVPTLLQEIAKSLRQRLEKPSRIGIIRIDLEDAAEFDLGPSFISLAL